MIFEKKSSLSILYNNVIIKVTVIGRLYRETDTVLKKLLILIKY